MDVLSLVECQGEGDGIAILYLYVNVLVCIVRNVFETVNGVDFGFDFLFCRMIDY